MRRTSKRLTALLLVLALLVGLFAMTVSAATEVYDTNLALNKAVTASSDIDLPEFHAAYLTDGMAVSGDGNLGYSSKLYGSSDISSDPAVVQVDLGEDHIFNQMILYPRTDVSSAVPDEATPNFPVSFVVEVSSNGSAWETAYTVTENPNPNGSPQPHAFEAVSGRFVRITTTKLGHLPANETGHHLQLAEIELYNRENLALGKAAAANRAIGAPVFQPANLVDGVTSVGGENVGYTSKAYGSPDLSADPNWLVVDLGENKTFNQVVLYPRDSIAMANGGAANFPVDFVISVSTTGVLEDYQPVLAVTDGPCDSPSRDYIYNFESVNARYIWIKTTGLSGLGVGETAYYTQLCEIEVYNRDSIPQQAPAPRSFLNLPYADQSDYQKLDIRLPIGEGPFPVVVYFHGGAWLIGDKTDTPESQAVLDTLIAKGYAVVSVNYRLASEAKWPAQIYDCKAAIRWIRAHAGEYGFDSDKIVAFGSSAGGHLALMTGLTNGNADMEDLTMGNAEYSSDVMAVISNYGISDLTKWNYRSSLFASLGDPNVALLGENYTEEQALAASPITYVSSNSVPVLLCHGQNDTLVEPYHSSDLETAIVAANGVSKVDTYYPASGAHGDGTFWNGAEPTKVITDFLGKWFNPHTALANGNNSQSFSNVDLKTYDNATTMLQYADDSSSQILHIVTPAVGAGPFPTIVFIHGGGFNSLNSSNGSIYWVGRGALEAVKEGYAVAFVDYRLGGEANYPAPVHDIKTAIRYLRANADTYHLDTERFAIWGESAGGHLASFVALTSNNPAYEDLSMGYADYSSAIQACVAWYPITDLTTACNQQWTPNLMGYGVGTDYDACWDASPVAQVTENACPFYLQHGMADTLVEYQDSIDLYERLVAATGEEDHRLELFPGLIHGPGGMFLSEKNLSAVYAWLDDKLDVPELAEDQLAARTTDNLINAIGGEITRDSEDSIIAARRAYEALSDEAKALVTKLANLEAAEAAFIALMPDISADGRVSIKDGCLVVPGGSAVTYYTKETFSGNYTVEMRASVSYQAVGLFLGNGIPYPALWSLALVDPSGVWIHQSGSLASVNKVANADVAQNVMVDLKVEILGTTAKTYINGTLVDTCTLPDGSTSGPLGLRFYDQEAGSIDCVKVIQNGSVVFEDDFNYLSSKNWTIPVEDYNVNLALGKSVAANSDVGLPQYFAISYLTDGVTACGDGNFGYSSKRFGSTNISSDPATVTVDLGTEVSFNHVVLHPRNDVSSTEGNSPSFMKDFFIRVSSDGSTWATVYHVDDNPNPNGAGQGHAFERVKARYVQIVTTELGPMPDDNSGHYLQFAEIEVYNRENLALGKSAGANSDVGLAPGFQPANLVDGITAVVGNNVGYSSKAYGSPDLSADPNWLVVDLGENQTFNQVVLYPRSNIAMADGGAANFPVDFVISVSTTGVLEDYRPVLTVTDGPCDSPSRDYIYNFETVNARYIWIKTTGLSGMGVGEVAYYTQLCEVEVYNRDSVPQQAPAPRSFRDLPYANNSATQLLDIHLPDGEGPFPVVVYFHGGAWLIGDKVNAPEAQGILDAIVNKGYAVVSVDYRLASEAPWPAQIYDCKAAIRYVRANAEVYGFDPDRIAVFGASAGAHLALMTGLTNGMAEMEDLTMGNAEYSSDVMAVVSNYGISDLTRWNDRSSLFASMGDPIAALLGEGYTEEEALAASPITYVSENSIPVYLAHGQNDTLVEPYHSTDLQAALEAVIDPELVDTYYPSNAPHANTAIWNSTESITNILAFLQKRFEPHVSLTNGDNFRSFSSLDLNTYPNATLNLQYAGNSSTQKLHIVTPETGEGPYPTIVFIHGGGFNGGNSSGGYALYTARGPIQALEDGYAVALVDYRYAPEVRYPTPIHDVKAAIRYLRANADTYNLDSDRFAIWGESAGGYLVDIVALTNNNPAFEDLTMGNAEYSSAVQACVSWYAITDLTTATNQQWTPNLMGFGVGTSYDACWNASPLANVPEDPCPFYLQHGLADDAVDYEDSLRLYEAIIQQSGDENRAKLELFPGINHATAKFLAEENVDKIVAWLDETLPDVDMAKAEAVDALIAAIGEVKLDSKGAIEEARAAYEALTEEQKALVTKLTVLEAAEAAYEKLLTPEITDVALILTGAEETDVLAEKVAYKLSARNMVDLATVVVTIDLDETYLTDPVAEAADGWYIIAQVWRDGVLNVAVGNNAGADGEGDLLTVTAKPTGEAGETSVSVTFAELCSYEGEAETYVNAILDEATVTTIVVVYSIYDVNRDGIVDQLDMTRAQRLYGTDNTAADINDDGDVNIDDLILILNNFHERFA